MNNSFKKWILRYIIITTGLVIIYVSAHLAKPGKESVYLTENQKTFILNLKESFDEHVTVDLLKGDSLKEQKHDSILELNLELIDNYIKCCSKDSISKECYEGAFEHLEKDNFKLFLKDFSWSRNSFFWLDSNLVIVEIIFWSFIGVLCSLLFHGSEAIRQNKFDPKELAVHYSKLTYSPIVTLIIVFSSNVLANDGSINVEGITYWVIVFSFILGFYSRRTIDLLDRIKDLVFRSSPSKQDAGKLEKIVTGKVVFDKSVTSPPINDLSNTTITVVSMTNPSVAPKLLKADNGSFEFTIDQIGAYKVNASLTIDNQSFEGSIELNIDNFDPIEDQIISLKVLS